MLSSTPLPGPLHTPSLRVYLMIPCPARELRDETVPELGTGEEIRLSSTWSRKTIRQNNSEITGRASICLSIFPHTKMGHLNFQTKVLSSPGCSNVLLDPQPCLN